MGVNVIYTAVKRIVGAESKNMTPDELSRYTLSAGSIANVK